MRTESATLERNDTFQRSASRNHSTRVIPVAPTQHEPHDDGVVWVLLVLQILINLTAFYLVWAKLSTSWPFGL